MNFDYYMASDLFTHDATRIICATFLALICASRHKFFARVLASEMIVSSIFVQILILNDIKMNIYYDVVMLLESIMFNMILIFRIRKDIEVQRGRTDGYLFCGSALFLLNSVVYMIIVGEFLMNYITRSNLSQFISSYSDIMIVFQAVQIALLVMVIDKRIMSNISSKFSNPFRFMSYIKINSHR